MNNRQEIQDAFSRVPANQRLGFQLISQSPEVAVVEMKVSSDLMQKTFSSGERESQMRVIARILGSCES